MDETLEREIPVEKIAEQVKEAVEKAQEKKKVVFTDTNKNLITTLKD